jgi:hypothetical protein
MQRTLVQILIALTLGWLMSQKGLAWISTGFVIAGVVVWPWAQWLANRQMQLSFANLARAVQAPLIATAVMAAALILSQRNALLSTFALGVQVVSGAAVFLLVHWVVIKLSSGAHNALEDLTRLFAPRPID